MKKQNQTVVRYLLTDAVKRDLDGVTGSPNAGVDEETERHHPQSQDGGASGHTDAADRKNHHQVHFTGP